MGKKTRVRRTRQYYLERVPPWWWRAKPLWFIEAVAADEQRQDWLRRHGNPKWGKRWSRRVFLRELRAGRAAERRFWARCASERKS